MKRLIVVLTVALIALLGASVVAAQGHGGGRGGRGEDGRGFGFSQGRGQGMGMGMGMGSEMGLGLGFDGEIIDIITAATGLDGDEIISILREGEQSLADLISANGGDVEAVQAEITALMQTHMAERMAERSANLESRVEDMLNRTAPFGLRGRWGDALPNFRVGTLLTAQSAIAYMVDNSDLTRLAIHAALQDGATLAEIASEAELDTADISAALQSNIQERLSQAVENGRITQAQSDELLAELPEQIENLLNTPLPQGGRGLRGRF